MIYLNKHGSETKNNIKKDRETVSAYVLGVVYENEDNGYKVIEAENNNIKFTAVGYLSGVNAGDGVKLTGVWTEHKVYGEQLKVEMFEKKKPAGKDAVFKYLASGIIKGVRESTARKIVERFGEDALDILETAPQKLAQIKGISAAKAQAMHESYIQQQGASAVVMFLQQYGVTPKASAKIFKKLGSCAVDMIRDNPYLLCDEIDGIGFKTADGIALKMSYPNDDMRRIRSGTLYTLKYNTQFGHTYLPKQILVQNSAKLLNVDKILVMEAIEQLLISGVLKTETIGNEQRIYFFPYYMCEKTVADKIKTLASVKYEYTNDEADSRIDIIEKTQNMHFAALQREAVKNAMFNSVLVITGGPGTGKTTIINAIIDVMRSNGYTVTLTAPTGRAAKRMSQVCRLEAKTIHRLLGATVTDREQSEYTFAESEPIETDAVIVDEMSMVDIVLMNSLLAAIKPKTRLILVGDSNQLPSVGPGNVLRDIIDSNAVKVIRLTEIFRQARESMIVMNAHNVIDGKYPCTNKKDSDFFIKKIIDPSDGLGYILELCKERLPKAYGFDPLDIQVLSPAKKGVTGVYNLNKGLQQTLNPPSKEKHEKQFGDIIFREGDKVMQIRNNYDLKWELLKDGTVGSGVFNGDVGYIESINDKIKVVTVVFDDKKVRYDFRDLDEIDLAYCITVHKSQGSEFPAVIIPLYEAPFMLLSRNVFYTGITRAKQLVVLVGKAEIMYKMIDNNREDKRFSGLKEKLETNDEIIRF